MNKKLKNIIKLGFDLFIAISLSVNITLFSYLLINNLYDQDNHYAIDLNLNSKLEGIYVNDKLYCVFTDDTQVWNDTNYHEACHHQVYKDHEHFCER